MQQITKWKIYISHLFLGLRKLYKKKKEAAGVMEEW